MFGSVKRMFRKQPGKTKLGYEESRRMLESHNAEVRAELAGREDTKPEMLYYLAADEEVSVRKMIAGNPSTPAQAFRQLTDDASDEVRCELAFKIGRLIPGLNEDEASRIREFAIEALERLAEDQEPRVRQIIAEEISHAQNIPTAVVQKLARDLEISVAGPILEFSPLLSDDDLLEVIACGQVRGALDHIARRAAVSGDVSHAVAATLDVTAVAALLNNENAQIREDTLDLIIDNARDVEEWHEPVAMRSELSLRALRRIAGFVAFSILSDLGERTDLDPDMQTFLKQQVRARLEREETLEPDLAEEETNVRGEVEQAWREGRVHEAWLSEQIDMGRRAHVVEGLSLMSEIPTEICEKILRSKDGRPVTALVWASGLPMRLALDIQRLIAHVPPSAMVMARDGIHFSLSEQEMKMHLGFFAAGEGQGKG